MASKSESSGRFVVSSSARSSCTASKSIRRTRVRVACIRSAISSSRRVSPFFCGAAFPTTSCSRLAERGELRKPAVLDEAGHAHDAGPAFRGADRQLRWPVAVPAQRAGHWSHGEACSRTSTTTCARRSGARRSSSSRAWFARTAVRSICCAATTPSSTSDSRCITAFATIKGQQFRRYSWPQDDIRRGILGQGSILTLTSYPDRTSPVVRGKWVLENILGTPPPPPLPDVGDLKTTDGPGGVLSMRERLAMHRASPRARAAIRCSIRWAWLSRTSMR